MLSVKTVLHVILEDRVRWDIRPEVFVTHQATSIFNSEKMHFCAVQQSEPVSHS